MTATLRAQLPLGPKGSPPSGRTTPQGELRAERRPPAECDGGHVPGRRSKFAQDLLGWSGALESRLVTFAEYRKEAA